MAAARHLTPEELAERLQVATETLRDRRRHGQRPRWIKVGQAIRYPLNEIEDWEQQELADCSE